MLCCVYASVYWQGSILQIEDLLVLESLHAMLLIEDAFGKLGSLLQAVYGKLQVRHQRSNLVAGCADGSKSFS